MVIRKPRVSVTEARQLAKRSTSSKEQSRKTAQKNSKEKKSGATDQLESPPLPHPPASPSSATESADKPLAPPSPPKRTDDSGDEVSIIYNGLEAFSQNDEGAEKVQIFLSAVLPAKGVSLSYDTLTRRYAPARALQMILRRAMDDYEDMLADGTFLGADTHYDMFMRDGKKTTVQTSRIMPVALIERARQHFDPMGFESARAFGLMVATAALAAFFQAESKYESDG